MQRRHAVDCTHGLAIDQNDALVSHAHLRQILLCDERFLEHRGEHFNQRGKILVVMRRLENARTAIAIKRLQDDLAMFSAERIKLCQDPA